MAGEKIDELADFGNKYITEEEPWSKEKDNKDVERVLNNISFLLKKVILLYTPIIPDSCLKAGKALENREKVILFEKI